MGDGVPSREVMATLGVECSMQACTIRRPTFGLRSMIFRNLSFSRTLAVLALLVVSMPAQRGETGGTGELTAEQIQAMRGARQKQGMKRKGETDAEMEERWANMTPDERLDAGKRRGSKAHCRFVAACRPPKLLPGQSGVMLITAILQGQAVLPAPLNMVMTPRVKEGTASLGNLAARPANPGTIAKAYLGRPVYENTAVFEVPVTLGKDAKLGEKTPLAVDLQFDIYHGDSGQAVGRFIERVSTDVEVAPHVDPQVVGGRGEREAPQPKPTPVVEQPKPAKSDDASQPDSNTLGGGEANTIPVSDTTPSGNPEEASDPQTGGGDLPPAVVDEGGLPLPLMIGAGVFLLVIALLVMRKK